MVQTQRLGDVLCATPVYAALREQFPHAHLATLVHRPNDQILQANPDLNEVLTYDRQSTHKGFLSRFQLMADLREREYDWALVIHAASSVAFALAHSGIPWRTCVWREGDRRKPHWSWYYHQHVRQNRLVGTRHEIEHNLDALRELGMTPGPLRYRVYLRPEETGAARRFLRSQGWSGGTPLAIIHPGHGGGRQGWPAEHYGALADRLTEQGWTVGITGGPAEGDLVDRVASCAAAPVLRLAGSLSLREFAAVLGQSGLFVSVSTGPMHLASALNVPTVTLYGPTDLRHEATRFSPYGSRTVSVISPVTCPCPGSRVCQEPVCMTGLTPDLVLDALSGGAAAGWGSRQPATQGQDAIL